MTSASMATSPGCDYCSTGDDGGFTTEPPSPGVADDLELEVNLGLFVVLGAVSALTITTNTLTVAIIARSRTLQNVTGYLMVSLAAADLCVGVTTLIPLVYSMFTKYITRPACASMGFLASVVWVVSVYTLALLSLDRYVAIVHPLTYTTVFSQRRIACAIALVWLLSAALWVLPLAGVGAYKFNDEEVACYFDVAKYPTQWIVYMVIIFVPASAVMIFSYISIFRVSRRQNREIKAAQPAQMAETNKNNYKALRTLLIINGAFYVAWIPFVIEHIVKAVYGKLENIAEWLEIAIFVLAITNSFWNPLIYIGTNRVFRRETLLLLRRCCPCCLVGGTVDTLGVATDNSVEPAATPAPPPPPPGPSAEPRHRDLPPAAVTEMTEQSSSTVSLASHSS